MYPSSPPQLLVVAAPDETRGGALADALRQIGWVVALATAPEQAAWAAHYAGCIVVLTPAMKDDPVIQAALAARPARLVSVFAEPTVLPHGPWTASPVRLGEDMAVTARDAIVALFPVVSPAAAPSPYSAVSPSTPIVSPMYPFAPPPPSRQSRRRALALALGGAALALLLVVTSVLVLHAGGKAGTTARLAPTATTSPIITIANPGLGCDTSERALWETTGPISQVCTPQGTDLSMTHADGYLEGLYFGLLYGATFPTSYRVAVKATLLRGDMNEEAVLSVHDQKPGGQIFEAFANSEWQVGREDENGNYVALLSRGFLPQPVKTLALAAEVDGTVMHFTVNGQAVATVTDPTFLSSTDIFFGIDDYSSTSKPFSARFSDFTYAPLPDPTLSTAGAVATATAQTQQQDHTPYRAAVPGFGCDQGKGVWSPISYSGDGATKLACTASGMLLEHTKNTGYIGEERFYWYNGLFPANYSVEATVTFLGFQNCGDILTRNYGATGYSFRICSTGYWAITKYDTKGTPTDVTYGYVATQTQQTLRVTDNGSQQSLVINGRLVGSITDSAYHTTSHISLAIDTDPAGNGVGALVFSNFVFTPLP